MTATRAASDALVYHADEATGLVKIRLPGGAVLTATRSTDARCCPRSDPHRVGNNQGA